MDEVEEIQQNNMISNLPLLFANGYPTSLEKITEAQLEQFIPFMVQCSLGHINLQSKYDFNEPEWWPEDVAFTIPFSKPKKFLESWKDKMKDIVNICYQFHRSVFLLRFCKDLATFEHASLRFINNYNSTTSLFDRRSNKLLVTFRNENMSYDQPQRSRKCLLHQKCKRNGKTEQQIMVEPAPFDIYLCEYCDAELYSEEALKDHEKTCSVGDVIICDSPEPTLFNRLDISQDVAENNELRANFLLNFNLQRREDISCIQQSNTNTLESKDFIFQSKQDQHKPCLQKKTDTSVNSLKRPPRRNRAVHSLSRCPAIPLSSPAGQLLVRTSKIVMTQDYLMERLDRIERFCHAPILTKGSVKPKYLFRRYNTTLTNCTFKKPQEYSERQYVFPRRQFSQKHRAEQFSFVNSLLIKKCRPMTVRLKKISESEIMHKRISTNTKLNIKLTRDATRSSNWKISSSPSSEIIVDTINLCSSDEEEVNNKDEYPVTEMKLPSPLRIINCRYSNKPLISKFANHLSSEVTLTPIRQKAFENVLLKQEKKIINPSLHIIAANATRPTKVNKTATLGATMEAVLSNNLSTPPKPLQPSVFFFSNYTSCPISIVSSNNNEIFGRSLENNFQTQNQENHIEKKDSKKFSTPSIPISAPPDMTTMDWFPTNVFPATISSINNNHRNDIATRSTVTNISIERSSKTLPLIQCKRIISIDLTS